jgi:hypothetical protein
VIESSRPRLPYAALGGENGMKLARAAFAVMIKFSDLQVEFESLVDEIAMDSPGLEPKDIVKLVKESH